MVKEGNGAQLSDEAVKGTLMFKENESWIQGVKDEGYDIIDIGADGSGKQSSFYNMEKSKVYGSDK